VLGTTLGRVPSWAFARGVGWAIFMAILAVAPAIARVTLREPDLPPVRLEDRSTELGLLADAHDDSFTLRPGPAAASTPTSSSSCIERPIQNSRRAGA